MDGFCIDNDNLHSADWIKTACTNSDSKSDMHWHILKHLGLSNTSAETEGCSETQRGGKTHTQRHTHTHVGCVTHTETVPRKHVKASPEKTKNGGGVRRNRQEGDQKKWSSKHMKQALVLLASNIRIQIMSHKMNSATYHARRALPPWLFSAMDHTQNYDWVQASCYRLGWFHLGCFCLPWMCVRFSQRSYVITRGFPWSIRVGHMGSDYTSRLSSLTELTGFDAEHRRRKHRADAE